MESAGRRRVPTGALALIAGAIALASSLSVAEGTRTVRIPSQITIHENGLQFKGKVTATNDACLADRKVTLFRRFSDGSHQAYGSDMTGAGGHWHIQVSGSAGISMARFYAKAHRRSEGTAGTIYVCQRARSRTISFH
jgi:hypothetical protein